MRLNKIKLAGFKSFVDPTSIPLPSNLIGIVGPNGCGKSNIIDAVRWVMGESSAKHLRGDSMADVIFNGSTSRKPVGQASIELVFDNSDGSVGGQYAQYNEISVKRVVSRDGQSNYYLNGTRCRRRDITDIFLGTGLGPRSYAIIEQGTISRIIEAKPEELRIFLEEAAGISKYKERRRETENRMRHTHENLERLNDLRDELTKQLAHLQRQAKTAEKYKELKQEERLLRAQLQALRWRGLDAKAGEVEARIKDSENRYEAEVARQRSTETEIEKQRELHVEANDRFNAVQGRFYSVGADIARLEQNIQHSRERRQQQQQDLAQLERTLEESRAHLANDQKRLEELRASLQENEPALQAAEEAERASAAALAEAEQAMQDWQSAWDAFNEEAAEPARTAEVERARIEHQEQHSVQLKQRLERYEEELAAQSTQALETEIEDLTRRGSEAEAEAQRHQAQLQELKEQIGHQREQNNECSRELDEARSELQSLRGRHASLEALQQAALGKREGAVSEWLEHHNLAEAKRLAEGIEVERGWERAVECVLGLNLEAVCTDDMDPLVGLLGELEHGSLVLFDTGSQAQAAPAADKTPLLSKVQAPWSLGGLLGGVYAAESLEQALAQRHALAAHESFITREGIWVGSGWLRVVREEDERAGVLEREQEMKELGTRLHALAERVETLQERLDTGREALHAREAERDAAQAAFNQANHAHAGLKADLSARQSRLEQARTRHQRLEADIEETRSQIAKDAEELSAARGRLESALARMQELEQRREQLNAERETLRTRLEEARARAHADRDNAHAVALKTGTLRTELSSTEQGLERVQGQLDQLGARRDELQAALAEGEAPINAMGEELEGLLALRVSVESELSEARTRLEEIDHRLRELDTERAEAEQRVQEIRSELEQVRIGWQEVKVRRQTLQEQVAESGYELKTLLEEMPEGAEEGPWAEQVETIERRIQRLGPINLAAIEEFEQQSERKNYLDAQHGDLSEALETLENAIRKIDRETRTRFKETFDKVNAGVQSMFPRLFGGGHAYLDLTGDDLLETGVTVMARPPGKRNSTIHLLSGGEKALTAVALVFAIFELNPAPFCLLDEVDAPLDDVNVDRYNELVRQMTDRSQFIVITHNKRTMEIADKLYGVTMQEPGVSKL
ncbi:MAG TPA: chromosome segregation protein SMC, partial [Gammaproteobacteria bacterium]|nr:chromosome segregation protein SMC [Gammaproteobacteria bacterium]